MRTVVVVGGGCSGTLATLHLLRTGTVRVVLVEPSSSPGRGLAYSPPTRDFLLNVPAGRMSAWSDRPGDFLQWLRRTDAAADAATFASRAAYGDYLADLLASERNNPHLDLVRDRASDLERRRSGFRVTLASGRQLRCWGVVLALGNAAPRPLPGCHAGGRSDRVVDHPLADLRSLAPDADATIGIVGTGLTALDVIMWLDRQGHRGRIVAVSRHGLTPIPHTLTTAAALPQPPDALRERPTVIRLLRWLRATGSSLAAAGSAPCRAVDALRRLTTELWQDMTPEERRRFCRHARPYWDVHRHRAPPELNAILVSGIAKGRIEVRAARVLGWKPHAGRGIRVSLQPREDPARVDIEEVDWLVNCTGPERDARRQPNPLVQGLLANGMVAPDPLGLGIRTGPQGEVLDRMGVALPGAFAIGPWRVAGLWESTAVPELRGQAATIAAALADSPRDRGADLRPHPGPDTITGPCSAQPVVSARVVVPGP